MDFERDKGLDLSDYVKLSVPELTTLKNSYLERIKTREENHWFNRLQSKYKYDFRKLLI